ncbi:6-phosphogluconolactonase, partial [candidate division KSB1 bacterium]|nr:6-phosphogluconolactonase [candidate division KSB1 bacterium]
MFQTTEKLVDGFSASFITEIESAKRSANPVHIALSGGNTPKLFFQKLADKTHEVDWSFVHFYWGDERCVPPEDEQSNYRMTQDFLLSKIDIPARNIHRLRGENDPVDEADRYAKELQTHLPEKSIDKPVFDWIILGIGEDGHT